MQSTTTSTRPTTTSTSTTTTEGAPSSLGQQQQQQQQQTGSRRQRSQPLTPQSIGVIVNGWPSAGAQSAAQACHRRGFRVMPIGLAMDDAPGDLADVPEVGRIQLCKFSDAENAKACLRDKINEFRPQVQFLAVVDASPNAADHVSMYNELQIPFILQTANRADAYNRAVHETEQAKTMALITERLNKRWSAIDSMWHEWSRRFPGLFNDFEFTLRSSEPFELTTTRSLLNSFSDLANREFGLEDVRRFSPGEEKSLGFTQGNISREYKFQDGSGSSSFSFCQSVNDEKEFGESAADSVAFLAQKSQEMVRPRVFNMLDVAQSPFLLTW